MIFEIKLTGKTVLLSGGYGYLGMAIAESLAHHGASVYILGRSKDKFLEAFKESQLQSCIHFSLCDVSSFDSIVDSLAAISSTTEIDVLINNAFYSAGQSPEEMSEEDWQMGIDGTLNSVFRCIKAIIPIFKKQGSGKIINVSSMYGMVAPQFEVYDDFPAFLNPPHYGAAKAGVIQLTKYYASYLGKFGIQVNAVTPGPFPSDSVQASENFIKALADRTCLKRIGKPEDLAGTFVFLASDAANYITGQNIVVDGGWTTR